MGIKKEKIVGKLIINEYESSNLKGSEYNTTTSELIIEFKKGGKYSIINSLVVVLYSEPFRFDESYSFIINLPTIFSFLIPMLLWILCCLYLRLSRSIIYWWLWCNLSINLGDCLIHLV